MIVWVSLEGHPIVAPKPHVPDIFALDDRLASLIMNTTRNVARATRDALAADGIYIAQTNGAAAGQSVFHYHVHVYPKWNDGRVLCRGESTRKQVMEKVRALLQT